MTGSESPLRIAVVGLGWIGEAHLTDLAARPDVTIAAVCDLDPALVADRAERFGARGYLDLKTLLDTERLDAVWICTPPQHHLAPARQVLDRGIAVYLEKPIARELGDAVEIVRLAEAAGEVCAIGYQWHSLDLIEPLRAELATQRVVGLVGMSAGPTAARPWFLDQRQGGGNLLERGSHQIDLVRAVAGEVVAVQATASQVQLDRPGVSERDIDDALTLVLHLATGAIAAVTVAWIRDGTPGRYSLDLLASDAVLRLVLDPEFRLSGHSRGRPVELTAATSPFTGSNTRFLDAVRAKDPAAVACTPENALGTLRVALAGERSLATGQKVTVA